MKVEKWKRPNGDIQIEITLWNNGYVITVDEALKLMELTQNALMGCPLEEEMKVIKFTVPGPPKGKGRARSAGGHHYTPASTVQYENLVKTCCQTVMNGEPPFQGMVQTGIIAYYPIPKTGSKKLQADRRSGAVRPTVKPDLDNIQKVIFDALNQIAYRDDAQVVAATLVKLYSDTPRVEVEILPC